MPDFIEPEFPFIIIKTTKKHVAACGGDIYAATRKAWVIDPERADGYEYVFSSVETIVKEVYKVTRWDPTPDEPGRYEFTGEIATDIRDNYVGYRIPVRFRKKGCQSPVLYSE